MKREKSAGCGGVPKQYKFCCYYVSNCFTYFLLSIIEIYIFIFFHLIVLTRPLFYTNTKRISLIVVLANSFLMVQFHRQPFHVKRAADKNNKIILFIKSIFMALSE